MRIGDYTTSSIIRKIENDGWDYKVVPSELWNEVFVTGTSNRSYIVRCNKRNSIVRIYYWMPLDEDIVRSKSKRLLQACDITNREMFLKARLFPDGIDIIYEIPERAGESATNIVSDVLCSFEMHIDQELFHLALTTEEDLYHYYEKRERKIHEEIKKKVEEHKKRKQESRS